MTQVDRLADVDVDVLPVLEDLARSLHLTEIDLEATLAAIVELAVSVIEPAVDCGVILLIGGKLVPQATVGSQAAALDVWQQQHELGPCIEAAAEQKVIVVDDSALETRWDGFGARASAVGVNSMLCMSLWVGREQFGTLSLYSGRPGAFDDHQAKLASLYATHAALALADVRRTEQLQAALVNRDVIGQAKGILMERHKVTAEAAFTVLAKASQAANRKLSAVAAHLVETGEVPGVGSWH